VAFGGRELRLILSIQSYGTGNIQRLRKDIASLSAATKAANTSSMQIAQRAANSGAAQLASGSKLDRLNQKLLRQQAQQIRLYDRTKRALSGLYSPGQIKTMISTGVAPVAAAGPRGKALILENRALAASIAQTTAAIKTEKIAVGELTAATQRLIAVDLPFAVQQERDAAAIHAKVLALQEAEIAGRTVAHIGRTMQFFGLITTAAFGLAAGSAAGFSKEIGLAATQMRNIGAPITDTKKKSDALSKAILDMMTEFPASSQEMTDAAYDIFSSMNLVHKGVTDVASGLGLLKIANKAAVAGQSSLEEATGAMIPILNNFDPQLRNVGNTMDDVFAIVRFGQMRLNDLGQAMATLAPISKAAGLSVKEMGGPFATLTLLMKNTARASAGLGRLFELLRLPAFQKGFEEMGISVLDANRQLRPLLDIMKDIVRMHPEVATGQKAAIEFFIQVSKASGLTEAGIQGTVQARRAFELLATNMGLFAETQGKVNQNTDEMAKAFAFMSKQPGVQWDVLINQMKAFIIIVGQAALPVLLALGQKISDLVKWFKELSPHTRNTIVRFATMTAIFALFGGTLVNIVGSMVAFNNNLKLMAILGGKSVKQFAALRLVIGTMGLVGLGLLLSQIIGIQKAVIVTTALWLIWKTKAIQSIYAVMVANVAAANAVKVAWSSVLLRTGLGALIVLSAVAAEWVMTHWDKVRAFFVGLEAAIATGWKNLMKTLVGYTLIALSEISKPLYELENRLVPFLGDAAEKLDNLLGIGTSDMKKRGQELIDSAGSVDEFRKAYLKAYAKFAADRKKKGAKSDYDFIKSQQALAKKLISGDMLEQLNAGLDGATDATSKAEQLTKAHSQAVEQALDNMNQKVQTAADNLSNIYDNFRQVNAAGLGSIFGGPTMTGILGNVFSGINDMLRQFGVQIPVPFELLQQDMDQQLMYFKRWRGGLDKLMKRGVPLEMIQQIQQLGPSAIPMIEGLLGASPKQFKNYVKDFKSAQKLLDTAAKKDMDRQLADWQKHGEDIAFQLVMGLASSPAQAKLKAGYKTWVMDTFGNVLRTEMATEVAAAMADAAAQIQATSTGIKLVPPKVALTPAQQEAAKEAAKPLTRLERTTIQARETRREIQAKSGQLQRAGARSTDPRGPGGKQITPVELHTLERLKDDQVRLQRRLRDQQEILQILRPGPGERRIIQEQLNRVRRESPGQKMVTINYGGDQVTIKADGATVASVMRALNTKQFRNRNKKRPRH